jgi:hypothetical protein
MISVENLRPVPAEPGAITVQFDAVIFGNRYGAASFATRPASWPCGRSAARRSIGRPKLTPEFVAAAKRAYAALSTWTRIF